MIREDRIKENEMGDTCGMHGGKEICLQGLGGEKL